MHINNGKQGRQSFICITKTHKSLCYCTCKSIKTFQVVSPTTVISTFIVIFVFNRQITINKLFYCCLQWIRLLSLRKSCRFLPSFYFEMVFKLNHAYYFHKSIIQICNIIFYAFVSSVTKIVQVFVYVFWNGFKKLTTPLITSHSDFLLDHSYFLFLANC